MKNIRRIALVLTALAVVLFAGCEQFFSTSLFSALQRDPSKLPFDQQVAFAESALQSGDSGAMRDAYDALAESLDDKNNTDSELNELAADLAIGASGLNDVLGDLADAAIQGDLTNQSEVAESLNDVLDNVDYSYVDAAVAQIAQIEANGGTPTESQYLLAGTGLLMKAGDTAGGIENLATADVAETKTFVDNAVANLGVTEGPLVELQSLLVSI